MTARKKAKSSRRAAAGSRRKKTPRSPRVGRKRRKPPAGEPDLGGRPAIGWTPEAAEDVRRLSRAGNVVDDMAAILGVSKRSLETAIATVDAEDPAFVIAEAYRLGRAQRRDSLRTIQLAQAEAGNSTMLVWLGKQDLGQRDYKRLEVVGAEGGPLAVEGDLGIVVKQRIRELLRSKAQEKKKK